MLLIRRTGEEPVNGEQPLVEELRQRLDALESMLQARDDILTVLVNRVAEL